ncbi:RagB/SusD family nutrient uptake outer membrane protein [Seonamhaeicola sp. NFXS20]|uniref:RagB/SusD family nutrient uptake outer membrane protein n=1 Tax=Seonamhaeicola sp. NFXS20 TaxID=2816959 RepID=UPI003B9E051B
MRKYKFIKYIILTGYLILSLSGCEKDWLDEKSDINMVVPETIKDFQALLDNVYEVNRNYSFFGNVATDNYFVEDDDLGALFEYERNMYSWDKEIVWSNGVSNEWNYPYEVVGYANQVLEGLDNIDTKEIGYNNLKGQAYFYRAFAYFNLSQVFCKPYDKNTAVSDLGLPIRLSADVNEIKKRSSLEALYLQIISDATKSLELLDQTPKYIQRPSKVAANALLARVYLMMDDFEKALLFADEVLKFKGTLIDFNNPELVSHTYAYKFPARGIGNPEIIFYVFSNPQSFAVTYVGNSVQASQELYNLYDNNDLRKEFFFYSDGTRLNYVSNYTGTFYGFGGLSVNEIILIRAECNARLNHLELANKDLNDLLRNRYKEGFFDEKVYENRDVLLKVILEERRKELPQNGNVRWEDLRRLNKYSEHQITLSRVINGQTRSLPPNDTRYVLPIPENEIRISGLEQNIR